MLSIFAFFEQLTVFEVVWVEASTSRGQGLGAGTRNPSSKAPKLRSLGSSPYSLKP